ncbi:MAG: hypothetical protein ACPIOQ_66630 [Promethearchaeia archaeon]
MRQWAYCSARGPLHTRASMIDAGRLSQACTQGEIDEAFSSAKKAQKLWAKTPLYVSLHTLKCCLALAAYLLTAPLVSQLEARRAPEENGGHTARACPTHCRCHDG